MNEALMSVTRCVHHNVGTVNIYLQSLLAVPARPAA